MREKEWERKRKSEEQLLSDRERAKRSVDESKERKWTVIVIKDTRENFWDTAPTILRSKNFFKLWEIWAPVAAQQVERWPSNLEVAGSNPSVFSLFSFFLYLSLSSCTSSFHVELQQNLFSIEFKFRVFPNSNFVIDWKGLFLRHYFVALVALNSKTWQLSMNSSGHFL